ncbi:Bud-site selection protein [Cubamyces lactineus]|nr:Bud-site selection protein [Cubamyces lactineus]
MAPLQDSEGTAARGTKRKRPAGKKAHGPPVKRETQGELISKKLHHGLHEVRKAAKKAEAFEIRKLVKRLKTARGEKPKKGNVKTDDPAELERQLDVLKHIDHEPFANTALRTKILKDRMLSENEDVKAALAEKLSNNLVQPQAPGSSAAKVHGRLLSSKIIADVVHTVVDSLKAILDPSLAKPKAKSQEPELELEGDESEEDEDEEIDAERGSTKGKKVRLAAVDESGDEGEEASDGEDAMDDAGWESGTVDENDDGAGWESGTVDDDEPRHMASDDEDESEDDENEGEQDDSEDGDEDSDSADEQPPRKVKALPAAKEPKGKSKAVGAESTFLPSLSVGFTRGDSDASDLSDADAEAAAADLPRKNRRGQRARRAIWEKKYGKNANHVKKQRESAAQGQQRQWNNGKGSKGPAREGGSGGKPGQGPPPRGRGGPHGQRGSAGGSGGFAPPPADKGWPKKQGAGADRQQDKKKDDKPLHPSWEAKRKLKEKLNPSIVPAQGKKIKFS